MVWLIAIIKRAWDMSVSYREIDVDLTPKIIAQHMSSTQCSELIGLFRLPTVGGQATFQETDLKTIVCGGDVGQTCHYSILAIICNILQLLKWLLYYVIDKYPWYLGDLTFHLSPKFNGDLSRGENTLRRKVYFPPGFGDLGQNGFIFGSEILPCWLEIARTMTETSSTSSTSLNQPQGSFGSNESIWTCYLSFARGLFSIV